VVYIYLCPFAEQTLYLHLEAPINQYINQNNKNGEWMIFLVGYCYSVYKFRCTRYYYNAKTLCLPFILLHKNQIYFLEASIQHHQKSNFKRCFRS